MHSRVAPQFALACVAAALAGCDADPLLAPHADEARLAALGASYDLTSTAASPSEVDLTWQDNSNSETGFEVHRSTTGAGGTFQLLATTGPNVANHSDTGLSPATQYCYKVRSFKATGRTKNYAASSNTSCVTTPSATPAAPSNSSAAPLNSRDVSITWTDNSANEDGFRVERSTDNGASWSAVIEGSANQTRTYDFGRSAESPQLCYRVVAFNSYGDSAPSNTDCTTLPAPPTTLSASAAEQAMVLTWTDNSVVEDGYEVQRAPADGPYSVIANLPANTTGYSDIQVSVDVTYSYFVRAKKDGGFSDQSNFAYAVVASGPPGAPSGTDAVPGSTTSIDIRWADNSGNEDGFGVERSTDGGTNWTSAGTVAANRTWFSDDGRAAEQQVCYRVLAFNGKGNSPPSNVDCASTTTGPINLTATVVDPLTVDLAWTDNSHSEDAYIVERIHPAQDSYWVIAELPANSTSYRDAALSFGPDQYAYRVVAKKDGGFSDYSNEALVNTSAPSASAAAAASPSRAIPSRAARARLSTRPRVRP